MREAMLHQDIGRAGWHVQRAGRCAMEVVRLRALLLAVEAIVGMHPRGGRSVRAIVAATHPHASRDRLAVAIDDVELDACDRTEGAALPRADDAPRATDH